LTIVCTANIVFGITRQANRQNVEKSQIRHSSYCRKKARNPPRPRKKSCISCTKAKTHCDFEFPTCSRCVKKNVTCLYQTPQHGKSQTGLSEQQQLEAVASSELRPSLDLLSGSSLKPFGEETVSHDPESFDLANDQLFQTPFMFGDFALAPITSQSVSEKNHSYSALIRHGGNSSEGFPFDQRYTIDFSSFEDLNPLWIEPVLRAPRAFSPKRVRYRQLSLNRKYVICTLMAYPHRMLAGKTLPPFMHPQCLIKESDQGNRDTQTSFSGPLATCAGIIAMWSVKNKNNSIFIWRAIRTEQERISEEVEPQDPSFKTKC
jgi:hypothetical protein